MARYFLKPGFDTETVEPLVDPLQKAPFVGPRGGMWADYKLTIPWNPKKHEAKNPAFIAADHVDNDKLEGIAKKLAALSPKQLAKLKAEIDRRKKEGAKRKEGVPAMLYRWGRVLDDAIKRAGAAKTPPAQKEKPKRKAVKKTAAAAKGPEKQALVITPPEPEPEAPKKKSGKAKPKRTIKGKDKIEEVGEHIFGSRRDLAAMAKELQEGRKVLTNEDLANMSFQDAEYLVKKQNLIPAHDLDTLKALGASPGTAHMTLVMLSLIKAKPDDTKAAREAYANDVRTVLATLKDLKSLEDFRGAVREMYHHYRANPEWVPLEKVDYGGRAEADEKAERLTKETGIEHAVVYSYHSGTNIARKQMRPFESLGKRFTGAMLNMGGGSRLAKSKVFQEAMHIARQADRIWTDNGEAGWDALKNHRGLSAATKKKKREEAKVRRGKDGRTSRGWSTAKEIAKEVKRSGHSIEVKDADPERVRNHFGLRNIDFGNWTSQADREYHLKAFEGAMHDFSEVLGLDPNVLSMNGRLGIAFGARGTGNAKAHYEPGTKAINITKFKGGGSLAHEWAHAMDNIMSEVLGMEQKGQASGTFMSQAQPGSSRLPAEVAAAMTKVRDAMEKHPDPVAAAKRHKEQARAIERQVNDAISENNKLVREYKKLDRKPKTKEEAERRAATAEKNAKLQREQIPAERKKAAAAKKRARSLEGQLKAEAHLNNLEFWAKQYDERAKSLRAPDAVMTDADAKRLSELERKVDDAKYDINKLKRQSTALRKLDPSVSDFARSASLLGKYWAGREEMFARGFESWVQDELRSASRENTYLAGGRKTEAMYATEKVMPDGGDAQPYPHGEERKRIGAAMRELMEVLKKHGHIEKAMRYVMSLEKALAL